MEVPTLVFDQIPIGGVCFRLKIQETQVVPFFET